MTADVSTARGHWALCARPEVPPGEDWLGTAERAALAGLRYPKRRADWLVGRWAAKQALARCLAAPGAELPFSRIQVLAAPDGAPEPRIPGQGLAASVSLSHSGQLGFAVACVPALPVGCDIEGVERRSVEFVRDYFTAGELALLEGVATDERPLLATLIWSAKESALKLRREGLRADTRSVEVQLRDRLAGRARGRFAIVRDERVEPLRGCWWTVAGHVCTVALGLASDPPEWSAPDERADWTLPR